LSYFKIHKIHKTTRKESGPFAFPPHLTDILPSEGLDAILYDLKWATGLTGDLPLAWVVYFLLIL
jgi:hypothetical protein